MKTDLFLYGNEDIFLFKKRSEKVKYGLSELKDFISFLKFMGHHPAKFTHVPDTPELLPNLTVKNNILLESVPMTLSSSFGQENKIKEHIKSINNPFMEQLLRVIPSLDIYPEELTKEQQKIIGILKGLIQDSKFIFLQSPELNLGPFSLELTANALREEVTHNKMIFISSTHPALWSKIITKIIYRNEKNEFRITQAPKTLESLSAEYEKEIIQEDGVLNFSDKKAA